MHNGAEQNEKVPNRMRIRFAFPNIKENTRRIKDAAEQQKDKPDCGNGIYHRFNGKGNQPPHAQIKCNRPKFDTAGFSHTRF